MSTAKPLTIIRGGGDLGTGVALRLHRAGWRVLITELVQPLVIRRTVALASAIYDGSIEVEGTIGMRIHTEHLEAEADLCWSANQIPVVADPDRTMAARLQPLAVIDAIMAKSNTGTQIDDAPIVVALGPGFTAGVDCHAVVETQRGHNLGRVYYQGAAEPNTGTPGNLGGQDAQRAVRAPVAGVFYAQRKIGDRVKAGDVIGRVITVDASLTDSADARLAAIDRDALQPSGIVVKTKIDGVLRGIVHDGLKVAANTKIADVDPRGEAEYCFTVSDKSWAVGGGALEAVLYLQQRL
ncbi:MAG: EF2563 family selenium-dependent molybdenum hydroxylase system protein [Chloroflexi bacterium]|nr:EF2563 family selenium-dependent molybdenum hydroxylase system protein [Chloroflexota bacterium]